MKICILGTGRIAKALGEVFCRKGLKVMFGSRDPKRATELATQVGVNALGSTWANAMQFGEVVVLAIPYKAMGSVMSHGGDLSGKIILDCTNAIVGGSLILGGNTSAAEQIAKMFPKAHVVKAFNTCSSALIEKGPFFPGPNDGSMFFCGDDAGAKKAVSTLIKAAGFEPVDAGNLQIARVLEGMALMMIQMGKEQGGEICLKLLKRE